MNDDLRAALDRIAARVAALEERRRVAVPPLSPAEDAVTSDQAVYRSRAPRAGDDGTGAPINVNTAVIGPFTFLVDGKEWRAFEGFNY